jgi:uncharacterized membrane protein YjjP (DUF1212 family)
VTSSERFRFGKAPEVSGTCPYFLIICLSGFLVTRLTVYLIHMLSVFLFTCVSDILTTAFTVIALTRVPDNPRYR